MTVRRRQRKDYGRLARRLAVLAGFGLAITGLSSAVFAQATTERVVVNRLTGLAISGFDPVAYFTETRAVRGTDQFEAVNDGAVWRFRNDGNRAAFLRHPDVYGPQFGGYDPFDVARGKTVEGRSDLWTIHGQRLFLFSSEASREAFAANPDGFVIAAQRRWPSLRQELSQ